MNTIIEGVLGEAEASLLHIYNQHAPLMHFLAYLNLPMPKVLEVSAEFVMNGRLRREFESGDPDLVTVQTLLAEAQSERVALDSAGLSYGIRRVLDRSFDRLLQAPTDLGLLMRLTSVIEIVHALPFEVNLWKVQNVYYELLQNVYPAVAVAPPNQLPATAEATENLWSDEAAAWTSHFERLGELLGFAMQEAAPRPTLPERAAA